MNKPINSDGFHFAALEARDFIRTHGNGLSEIMFALAGDHGLDLFCAADRALDASPPDFRQVSAFVHEIHDLLASCGTPEDRYANALRWHGARMADLARRLPS
ncbi:hypothetical protein [Sedimentitalea arenosa]|uniref:Uncharacterized protein n=1 Tax=Sedimentitalea arenosa TaxID=2798803 RepID=A0A8J7LTP8_9RHOB|nr:hypothetical protein [Arenibacterium arenosum]MBJ6373404.1 hypothetical protein [Arenibacterium arenosum]